MNKDKEVWRLSMGLQEISKTKDDILINRLINLMPALMKEVGIEMYIVVGDEYNEGPIVRSLLPSSFFHARRKSIFIFSNVNDQFRKMIVSKPDFSIEQFYEPVLLKPKNFDYEMFYRTFATNYDLETIRKMPAESEADCIRRLVNEINPKNIAIDISGLTAFSDGLSKTNYDYLLTCIDISHHHKIVSAEQLGIRWLETRTIKEIDIYRKIVQLTREIVKRCYSREVITPGVTTIGQARFFLQEEAMRCYGKPWFDATVWIRRRGHAHIEDDDAVIQEEDLLHCDFGFELYGLCSDIQEMAYVKGKDDNEVISQLEVIHTKAMTVQNCLAESFVLSRTGNEILQDALIKSKDKGIKRPMIYTHPIGIYGHGPGPTIGSFTNQDFVEGMGEYTLHEQTLYAMELNVQEKVQAWDDLIIMYGQEIDVAFSKGKIEFLGGRQKSLHII